MKTPNALLVFMGEKYTKSICKIPFEFYWVFCFDTLFISDFLCFFFFQHNNHLQLSYIQNHMMSNAASKLVMYSLVVPSNFQFSSSSTQKCKQLLHGSRDVNAVLLSKYQANICTSVLLSPHPLPSFIISF